MGYEVFRNQSSSGIIDVVAYNQATGELKKFDVKTAIEFKYKDGVKLVILETLDFHF